MQRRPLHAWRKSWKTKGKIKFSTFWADLINQCFEFGHLVCQDRPVLFHLLTNLTSLFLKASYCHHLIKHLPLGEKWSRFWLTKQKSHYMQCLLIKNSDIDLSYRIGLFSSVPGQCLQDCLIITGRCFKGWDWTMLVVALLEHNWIAVT